MENHLGGLKRQEGEAIQSLSNSGLTYQLRTYAILLFLR
jgi:hypothetical protein